MKTIRIFESDEGIEFIEALKTYTKENKSIKLEYFMEFLQKEGLLGKDKDDVDYLYDNTLVALVETYIEMKLNKTLFLTEKELDITSFSVIQEPDGMILRNKALAYLIDSLDAICEYDSLHCQGKSSKKWKEHIVDLKRKLIHEQKCESLILMIKKRQAMYVGSHSFHDLAIFIQTYDYTLHLHNIPTGYFFDDIKSFNDWLSLKINKQESSMGWMRMIKNSYAEEEQVEVFWNYYALYKER